MLVATFYGSPTPDDSSAPVVRPYFAVSVGIHGFTVASSTRADPVGNLDEDFPPRFRPRIALRFDPLALVLDAKLGPYGWMAAIT